MARPNRSVILDHLQTSLAAIAYTGPTGSYKTTAVTVERVLRDPQSIPILTAAGAEATPWFGCVPNGITEKRYQAGGWLDCTMPIVVAGAIAIAPGTVDNPAGAGTIERQSTAYRDELSSNLLDDIKYALCGTQTLSQRGTLTDDNGSVVPAALCTTITGEWADAGHEIEVVPEHNRVIAWAAVRAVVRYYERRTHS